MTSKILYLHGISEMGGAERALLTILEKVNRELFLPLVACPLEGPFSNEVRSLGVQAYPMVFPAWRKVSHFFMRWSAIWKLRNLLEELRPAILHVNDMYWVPQAIRAAKRLNIPVVATIRQNLHPIRISQYYLDRVKCLIVLSKTARDTLINGGVSPDCIHTIPTGVDIDYLTAESNGFGVRQSLGIGLEAPVIGCLANVLEIKGHDILLSAFAEVAQSYPDAHLLLVGRDTSPFGKQMHLLARHLGIEETTHFVGFQADVRSYISAMDFAVLPSHSEALPVALLEIMAMGKPVVASAVGGIPELIIHGETGSLVEPGNAAALSSAMKEYLLHPRRGVEEGNRAQGLVQRNYSVKVEVQTLEGLYRSLAAERSPSFG